MPIIDGGKRKSLLQIKFGGHAGLGEEANWTSALPPQASRRSAIRKTRIAGTGRRSVVFGKRGLRLRSNEGIQKFDGWLRANDYGVELSRNLENALAAVLPGEQGSSASKERFNPAETPMLLAHGGSGRLRYREQSSDRSMGPELGTRSCRL